MFENVIKRNCVLDLVIGPPPYRVKGHRSGCSIVVVNHTTVTLMQSSSLHSGVCLLVVVDEYVCPCIFIFIISWSKNSRGYVAMCARLDGTMIDLIMAYGLYLGIGWSSG